MWNSLGHCIPHCPAHIVLDHMINNDITMTSYSHDHTYQYWWVQQTLLWYCPLMRICQLLPVWWCNVTLCGSHDLLTCPVIIAPMYDRPRIPPSPTILLWLTEENPIAELKIAVDHIMSKIGHFRKQPKVPGPSQNTLSQSPYNEIATVCKWLNSFRSTSSCDLICKNLDNGPYSLFVCASYFISCSVHAWFASVTFIDCKWRWGCRHFWTFVFQCFV